MRVRLVTRELGHHFVDVADQFLQLVLRLNARLTRSRRLFAAGAMQVVNLSNSAHEVDQAIQLFDLQTLYDGLGPVFEHLFKFDCLKFKLNVQLVELVLVLMLLGLDALAQDLIQVGFSAPACLLLRLN